LGAQKGLSRTGPENAFCSKADKARRLQGIGLFDLKQARILQKPNCYKRIFKSK
jgi:hypothetical protein